MTYSDQVNREAFVANIVREASGISDVFTLDIFFFGRVAFGKRHGATINDHCRAAIAGYLTIERLLTPNLTVLTASSFIEDETQEYSFVHILEDFRANGPDLLLRFKRKMNDADIPWMYDVAYNAYVKFLRLIDALYLTSASTDPILVQYKKGLIQTRILEFASVHAELDAVNYANPSRMRSNGLFD